MLMLLVPVPAAVTLVVAVLAAAMVDPRVSPAQAEPTVPLEFEAAGGCSVGLVLSLSEVAVVQDLVV